MSKDLTDALGEEPPAAINALPAEVLNAGFHDSGTASGAVSGITPVGDTPMSVSLRQRHNPAEESTFESGTEARLARIKTIAHDVADRSIELNDRLKRRMTDPPELGLDADNHDEPSVTNEGPTTRRPERSDAE